MKAGWIMTRADSLTVVRTGCGGVHAIQLKAAESKIAESREGVSQGKEDEEGKDRTQGSRHT